MLADTRAAVERHRTRALADAVVFSFLRLKAQ